MIIQVIIVLLLFLYCAGTRNFDYWKKRGVKYCKPVPFFGNSLKKYFQKISPTDLLVQIYKSHPEEKYVGGFESNRPVLVLRDPELIQHVLVEDFNTFYAKGINAHNTEPLLSNLFSVDGDVWKLLRQKLSVAFTTSKLKSMFPTILAKAEQVVAIVKQNGSEMNARELTARYTTDVLTTCGFGIDSDTLNDDSSIFRELGKRIFKITPRDALVCASKCLAPEIFKRTNVFAPEIENKLTAIFQNVAEARDGKQRDRVAFIDILLSMKDKGKLIGDSFIETNEDKTPKSVEIEINDELLVAQVFILFGAGYETSSSGISYALNQLAYHPDKQIKCQTEIDRVTAKYGKITYEALNEMKYLDMCLNEALRMYPSVGFFGRKCMRNYTFPSTDLTIDKGLTVLIPVQAIQNDPKYFENPEEFIPERFESDNVNKMANYVFMPFGKGPRACIGQRLGLLQSKVCLAAILRECTVVPSASSKRRLVSDPTIAFVQNIKGGVPLAFISREL